MRVPSDAISSVRGRSSPRDGCFPGIIPEQGVCDKLSLSRRARAARFLSNRVVRYESFAYVKEIENPRTSAGSVPRDD